MLGLREERAGCWKIKACWRGGNAFFEQAAHDARKTQRSGTLGSFKPAIWQRNHKLSYHTQGYIRFRV